VNDPEDVTDPDAAAASDPGTVGDEGEAAPAEDVGRPIRRYRAAVSAGAMALAWANQEQAPSGALVVVDHEVSPMGRLAHMWPVPAESTLAFAAVLRPKLTAEAADVPWLLATLAVADGIEAAGGPEVAAAWPDLVKEVDGGKTRAAIRADVQLGPGQVRVAVATIRLDLTGETTDRRERLLEAIGVELDRRTAELVDGVTGPVAAYEQRCGTLGHNLKIRLVPRGELRGHASAIDALGRLELRSSTGMVERVSVNQVREVMVL
jgi:BirA family biotin operon repressor/biotin-[acetyl-CoA-carboxylase] ligase